MWLFGLKLFFLNSNSMILFFLIEYHNMTMFLMTNILIFLLSMLLFIGTSKMFTTYAWKEDNKTLEILWTIFPAYWLIMLAVPSLGNLYRMDLSKCEYDVLFKAIGNQWYWSYEYNMSGLGNLGKFELGGIESDVFNNKGEFSLLKDYSMLNNFQVKKVNLEEVVSSSFSNINYDGGVSFVSYMEDVSSLEVGDYRLLEVDNRVVCPGLMDVRVNITSFDVIHSWTLPSMSVKVDAVPGRLNCATFKTLGYGVFYGQCSEMCGAKHSFMPICLEAIPFNWFRLWIKEFQVGL
uniref:Cytochrome c oxidase subunit 2 n=1 Tax=Conchocele cf. bisecta HPD1644 TaxID=1872713 RepID=A0A1B4WRI5_9BIVA|nr:cytochrome c oxidase subunit II [Conchocele cf. bisecta HPD1644]